jgi:hypothetical protein
MSKVKILSALAKKNIVPLEVLFDRSCPTPDGYASGWDIEFSDETEDAVFLADKKCELTNFMEFDNLKAVMNFIKTVPKLD